MGYGDTIKLGRPTTGDAVGGAERKAAHISRHSQIDWAECADPKRRKRLEKNAAKWLKWYLPQAYFRPFEKPHYAIIDGAVRAGETGGRFAVAGERGIGKSVILWGVVLKMKLAGDQLFPACLPWDSKAMKRAFRFWKMALCFNDRIAADYPEYCLPFKHSKGVSQRIMSTTWKGGPFDGEQTGAGLAVGEGLIILPNNRGCIGGSTINGNPRGLNHPMADGKVLRPTIVLLDDVQDRSVAKSEKQVQDTIETINGDVGGMGESGVDMPMLMSGNCIAADDVMGNYLQNDSWESIKVRCVESWPEGWKDGDGPTAKLWKEWHALHKNGEGATKFYREHKAALTDGFVLSAPGTYRKKKGVPDAFCGVMITYYKMGREAFAAEKQQTPIKQGTTLYTLKPEHIIAHTTDRSPQTTPETVNKIVVAIDVNYAIGLTWVAVGFAAQTAHVIEYGLRPMSLSKKLPEQELSRLVYEELVAHIKDLGSRPYRIDLCLFDVRGWNYEAAYNLSASGTSVTGVRTIGAMGHGAKKYRPPYKASGQRGAGWHEVNDTKGRQYMSYNSDYWREIAQKAWLGSIGSPSSCDLPSGIHREFASQICREPLVSKVETPMGMRWEWATLPGDHDLGDAMHMAYAGADVLGMGTGGGVGARKAPVPRRRRSRQIAV